MNCEHSLYSIIKGCLLCVRMEEQERIIKLLEDNYLDNISFPENNYWIGFSEAVALIKGENNEG